FFFFSSRGRHTRCYRDWSSDVCSSDLCGSIRDGRRLVWTAQRRPCRAGRLVRQSREVSSWPETTDRQGSRARNGFWFVGRAGNRSEERRVGKEWRAL